MERRSLSAIALASAGAAVSVAVVVLLIKVGSAAPPPDVAPHELASAAAAGRGPQSAPSIPPPRHAAAPEPRPAIPRLPPAARGAPPSLRELDRVHQGGVGATHPPSEPTAGAAAAPVATPQQDSAMDEATGYYDHGDYEDARTAALDALKLSLDPMGTDRMTRIAASASCFLGDADQAREWYGKLNPKSQRDVQKRCRRVGIEL